jgi:hypothetical protein
VAIEARALRKRARLRTIPLWFGDDGWIGSLRSNRDDLDQQKQRRTHRDDNDTNSNDSFSHYHCFLT